MWKFLRQGLDLPHSSGNPGSLTHWSGRELLLYCFKPPSLRRLDAAALGDCCSGFLVEKQGGPVMPERNTQGGEAALCLEPLPVWSTIKEGHSGLPEMSGPGLQLRAPEAAGAGRTSSGEKGFLWTSSSGKPKGESFWVSGSEPVPVPGEAPRSWWGRGLGGSRGQARVQRSRGAKRCSHTFLLAGVEMLDRTHFTSQAPE